MPDTHEHLIMQPFLEESFAILANFSVKNSGFTHWPDGWLLICLDLFDLKGRQLHEASSEKWRLATKKLPEPWEGKIADMAVMLTNAHNAM